MDRPDVPDDELPVRPEPERVRPSSDPEAPEADALEQAEEVLPGERRQVRDIPWEADEADALDQADEVPLDDDDLA